MRIVAKDLSFTYNKKTKFKKVALDKVSLTIEEGEFFGIIGHTGSGKSTFIQHLNGLIPVESGELYVGDYNLKELTSKKKSKLKELRRQVGMVFQYPEYQLFANTVFEDVAFGYINFYQDEKGNKPSQKEVVTAVIEALNMVGLDYASIKDKSPFELSGGQRRRVAIAGVLVIKPSILVLDEPVAGLDPLGKRELMKLLHSLKEKYVKTIIIVSHDMNEVAENCTKVAVFSNGKLVKVDEPKNLFNSVSWLKELRLDAPITGYLVDELNKVGVNLDTNFSTDDFIEKIINYYRVNKKKNVK